MTLNKFNFSSFSELLISIMKIEFVMLATIPLPLAQIKLVL